MYKKGYVCKDDTYAAWNETYSVRQVIGVCVLVSDNEDVCVVRISLTRRASPGSRVYSCDWRQHCAVSQAAPRTVAVKVDWPGDAVFHWDAVNPTRPCWSGGSCHSTEDAV